MPDKKISDLTSAGALTGAEQVPIVQSGTTVKTLLSTLSNYIKSTITNYVPYTGAITDVNLGENGIQLGNLEFDNTPTNIPTTAGSIVWNDTDGTLDLKLKGGNVTLQVGQETVIRVVNKTATNVTLLQSNYQAVRITGAQGLRPKVDLAQATNDVLSAETIGLVTETIANNQEGFISTSGLVRGINTTGSLQSETWADGDVLYLSPTTAGNVTNIKPIAPSHLIIIGYVISAHITQGTIFVKVDNGYELNELHNILINGVANNDLLTYESATSLWKNKPFAFIPNVQSVTSAATVTPTTLNDEVVITAQAVALNIANPTGTAVQGQSLIIRIKDNGTARAITYDTQYRAIGVTLPSTTIISKTVYLGFIYNSTDTKWDCIGIAQQA